MEGDLDEVLETRTIGLAKWKILASRVQGNLVEYLLEACEVRISNSIVVHSKHNCREIKDPIWSPLNPPKPDGNLMDPPVSLPNAKSIQSYAVTTALDPELSNQYSGSHHHGHSKDS